MNNRLQRNLPAVALLALALASGVAWRTELELRGGWASLAWLGYFHWAVPICVLAFLVWVVWVARVRRPAWFAVVLLAFAFVAYCVVNYALHLYFAAGPSGMMAVMFLGRGDLEAGFRRMWLLRYGTPLLWSLLPLVLCGICRLFGVRITLAAASLSAVCFTLSWPLAVGIRLLVEEPDLIHALKSGFVIPFLVVSLGFPLLVFRSAR